MVPIADYIETLALKCDPFALEPPLLWPGLESFAARVIHELEFVRPVVWVHGPRGSGKSTLARHLQRQLQANADVLLFDVTQGVGPEQIAEQLNELLLLPSGQGELFAPAAQVLHSDESAGPIVLVVDNIDHWPVSQLAQWLNSLQQAKLLAASKLRLLLLACHSPELVPLDEAVSVQSLAMPSPDLEQTLAWLNALMARAGAQAAVFTPEIVTAWWRESEGNLARLIERARLFLLENSQKLSRAAPAAEAGRRPLPTAHIITAAALLAALAVVYLYSPEEDRPREQAVPLPAAASSSSGRGERLIGRDATAGLIQLRGGRSAPGGRAGAPGRGGGCVPRGVIIRVPRGVIICAPCTASGRVSEYPPGGGALHGG